MEKMRGIDLSEDMISLGEKLLEYGSDRPEHAHMTPDREKVQFMQYLPIHSKVHLGVVYGCGVVWCRRLSVLNMAECLLRSGGIVLRSPRTPLGPDPRHDSADALGSHQGCDGTLR